MASKQDGIGGSGVFRPLSLASRPHRTERHVHAGRGIADEPPLAAVLSSEFGLEEPASNRGELMLPLVGRNTCHEEGVGGEGVEGCGHDGVAKEGRRGGEEVRDRRVVFWGFPH